MNAIEDNRWSRGFAALADLLPRPRAILAISAHWYVDGAYVMANAMPRTIHDFGGFPRGGKARASKLSPEHRKTVAQKAARKRWADKDR